MLLNIYHTIGRATPTAASAGVDKDDYGGGGDGVC
jgi:hypothetical protein